MRLLEALTDRMLCRAANRWPDDLAEDMRAEWRAELAWSRIQRPGAAGGLRRLRFALSLATSPAPAPDGQPVSIWRRSSPFTLSAAERLPVLIGAGLLLYLLFWSGVLPHLITRFTGLRGVSDAIVEGGLMLLLLAGGTVLSAHLGARTGRRLPLRIGVGPFARWAAATTVTVSLGAGLALWSVPWGWEQGHHVLWLLFAIPFVVWAAGARAAAPSRPALAVGGFVLAQLLAVVLSCYQAMQVLGGGLSPGQLTHLTPGDLVTALAGTVHTTRLIDTATSSVVVGPSWLLPAFLACTGFAVGYLRASVKVVHPAPRTTRVSGVRPAVVLTRRQWAAAVVLAGALSAWALDVAVVHPQLRVIRDGTSLPVPWLWLYEQRQAALLLAVLAFVMLLAGTRRVLVPTGAFTVALLMLDRTVSGTGWTGAADAVLLTGLAGALAVATWCGSAWGDRRTVHPRSIRHSRITVALVAGCCAPVLLFQWRLSEEQTSTTPGLLAVISAILMLLMGVLAGLAVSPARPSRRLPHLLGPPVLAALGLIGVSFVGSGEFFALAAIPVACVVLERFGLRPFKGRSWGPVVVVAGAVSLAGFALLFADRALDLMVLASGHAPHTGKGIPLLSGLLVVLLVSAGVSAVRGVRSLPGSEESRRPVGARRVVEA